MLRRVAYREPVRSADEASSVHSRGNVVHGRVSGRRQQEGERYSGLTNLRKPQRAPGDVADHPQTGFPRSRFASDELYDGRFSAHSSGLVARIFLTHPPEALKNYYGDRALTQLKAVGEVRFNSAGRELSTQELIEAARGCELIISYRQTPGEAELFRSSPDLVAFSRCAIDIRNVDVPAASEMGILVTQASAGFVASVAEWAIGAMIDLGRSISASNAIYHAGSVPAAPMGRQLRGATLGVIGYGQIGRYQCELGLAMGMRVLVTDPHARIDHAALVQLDLPELLAQSDFVVCLAVATEATENLMNAQAFARMKPGAFFVNASRGNLVDEAALEQALNCGHLAGCALDVGRAPDQMPTPALARHPRVIATPHVAGLTPESIEHQSLETVAQAAEIVRGRVPKGAVNAASATRLARLRQG